MAHSLTESYYLKALEAYPWELAEVLENLNYALSYDAENAAANCLMGQLQMEYLKDYPAAQHYFESALGINPKYACALENLAQLFIHQRKLRQAHKLLHYAHKEKILDPGLVYCGMSKILERQGNLKLAKVYLKNALAQALSADEQEYFEKELERLKKRIKTHKSLKK